MRRKEFYEGKKERGSQEYTVEQELYIDRCDFTEDPSSTNFFGLMPGKVTVLRYGPTVEVSEIIKDENNIV